MGQQIPPKRWQISTGVHGVSEVTAPSEHQCQRIFSHSRDIRRKYSSDIKLPTKTRYLSYKLGTGTNSTTRKLY